jgi:nucleoside permease NupC
MEHYFIRNSHSICASFVCVQINCWSCSQFVFGDTAASAGTFALNVFPAIIFFASTVQILYYIGAIQWLLKKMSVVFITILDITGAESIVAIASVSFFFYHLPQALTYKNH